MRVIGDYEWQQISMWDCTPEDCIQKLIASEDRRDIFTYYLTRVKEVVSDKQYKTEVVESLEGVPKEVLSWRNNNYKIKGKGAK